MENKIPGLSLFNYDANISDYYGNSSLYFFLWRVLIFLHDVISCNFSNVENFHEV